MLIQGSGISGISARVRHKVFGMGMVLDCGTEFPLHVDIWLSNTFGEGILQG